MQHSHIAIIGAPLDLGQDRRGVDMGPSAIRVANLNKRLAALGYHADDLGNVPVDQPESLPEGPDRAKYLPQIALACKRLALMVDRALTKKKVPLVLGGDHSDLISRKACRRVPTAPSTCRRSRLPASAWRSWWIARSPKRRSRWCWAATIPWRWAR